jgi:hypothetical protein
LYSPPPPAVAVFITGVVVININSTSDNDSSFTIVLFISKELLSKIKLSRVVYHKNSPIGGLSIDKLVTITITFNLI